MDEFRRKIYIIKNHINFYEPEIMKAGKILAELEESLPHKKLYDDDYNDDKKT